MQPISYEERKEKNTIWWLYGTVCGLLWTSQFLLRWFACISHGIFKLGRVIIEMDQNWSKRMKLLLIEPTISELVSRWQCIEIKNNIEWIVQSTNLLTPGIWEIWALPLFPFQNQRIPCYYFPPIIYIVQTNLVSLLSLFYRLIIQTNYFWYLEGLTIAPLKSLTLFSRWNSGKFSFTHDRVATHHALLPVNIPPSILLEFACSCKHGLDYISVHIKNTVPSWFSLVIMHQKIF